MIWKDLSFSIKEDLIYHGSLPKRNYKQIPGLGSKVPLPVFKIKKFRCKKIPKGNRSGFRVIFIYHEEESLLYFTQFYYKKNDKSMEDRERILSCFS